MPQYKHVLVTGASSGIGRAIADLLIKKGYKVSGTSRNPEKIQDKISDLRYLKLDMQDSANIRQIAAELQDIDVLINNAGQSQIGPLEEVPMEKVRELFEINYFGQVELIKAMLPAMRERRKGMIINISSMSGVFGVAYTPVYCSTKFALEGLSRALRQELAPFGIKVVLLEPGYIATGLQQDPNFSSDSEYYERLLAFKKIRDRNIEEGADPYCIAKKLLRILQMKHPAAAYPVGGDAPIIDFLNRLLPSRLIEYFQRKKFKA